MTHYQHLITFLIEFQGDPVAEGNYQPFTNWSTKPKQHNCWKRKTFPDLIYFVVSALAAQKAAEEERRRREEEAKLAKMAQIEREKYEQLKREQEEWERLQLIKIKLV